jgi:hypothetical protein
MSRRPLEEGPRLVQMAGYVPERTFNATHGASRLLYYAADGAFHIDVFLDRFTMSHELDFATRLEVEPLTLAAELELSGEEAGALRERTAGLRERMEQAPKSRAWKLRAKIGRRKRWYETPEEVVR